MRSVNGNYTQVLFSTRKTPIFFNHRCAASCTSVLEENLLPSRDEMHLGTNMRQKGDVVTLQNAEHPKRFRSHTLCKRSPSWVPAQDGGCHVRYAALNFVNWAFHMHSPSNITDIAVLAWEVQTSGRQESDDRTHFFIGVCLQRSCSLDMHYSWLAVQRLWWDSHTGATDPGANRWHMTKGFLSVLHKFYSHFPISFDSPSYWHDLN